MLTVGKRPKPRWETITLDGDNSFEVRVTPPSFKIRIAEHSATTTAETVAIRLACITDWRGVVTATESGDPQPLPFDREALGDLLRDHRGALDKLLALVRPFFTPMTEASEKNCVAPPAAATLDTPPSIVSESFAGPLTSPEKSACP